MDNTCKELRKINYVLGVLVIFVIAILGLSLWVYNKYSTLNQNIIKPVEKLIPQVTRTVNSAKDVIDRVDNSIDDIRANLQKVGLIRASK